MVQNSIGAQIHNIVATNTQYRIFSLAKELARELWGE